MLSAITNGVATLSLWTQQLIVCAVENADTHLAVA